MSQILEQGEWTFAGLAENRLWIVNCRTYCLGKSHFLKHSRWTLPQIKLGPNPGSLRAGDLSEGNLGGSEGIRRFSAKLRPAGTAQDPQLSTAHLKYPRERDKYKDNEKGQT